MKRKRWKVKTCAHSKMGDEYFRYDAKTYYGRVRRCLKCGKEIHVP